MKRMAIGVLTVTAWASGALFAAHKPVKVEMKDSKGASAGTLTLKETSGGVAVSGKLTGLSAGQHGFHVHQKPACEGPGFQSAGGHFNPTNKHHGAMNPDGSHVGDLGNITADAKGAAKVNTVAKGATLGDGSNSLLANGGTAIVVHAKADDQKSDPAGNAGDRIACGVVK